MARKFRISLLYYRSMLPACLFVTAASLFWLHLWEGEGIPLLVLLKIVTLILFFFFKATLRSGECYYYYNFGISQIRLWLTAAVVDMVIFAAVIALTNSLFIR